MKNAQVATATKAKGVVCDKWDDGKCEARIPRSSRSVTTARADIVCSKQDYEVIKISMSSRKRTYAFNQHNEEPAYVHMCICAYAYASRVRTLSIKIISCAYICMHMHAQGTSATIVSYMLLRSMSANEMVYHSGWTTEKNYDLDRWAPVLCLSFAHLTAWYSMNTCTSTMLLFGMCTCSTGYGILLGVLKTDHAEEGRNSRTCTCAVCVDSWCVWCTTFS